MGVRVKPNAKDCRIKEQIIEDLVTGLTLQFAHRDADPERGRKETIKLTIYGIFCHTVIEISFSMQKE